MICWTMLQMVLLLHVIMAHQLVFLKVIHRLAKPPNPWLRAAGNINQKSMFALPSLTFFFIFTLLQQKPSPSTNDGYFSLSLSGSTSVLLVDNLALNVIAHAMTQAMCQWRSPWASSGPLSYARGVVRSIFSGDLLEHSPVDKVALLSHKVRTWRLSP